MKKNKKKFKLLILVCVCVLIAVTFIIKNSVTQGSNLNACKGMLINKYAFIDKIDISRNGPNLGISIQLKHTVSFKEIEGVLNEIINQPQAVFDDIYRIDKKKAGYIEQLYIGFSSIKDTSIDDYLFYSISKESDKKGFERFELWKLEHGGTTIDYVPIKQ